MKELLLYGFITIVVLAIPAGCAVYKFKDCKKVGHSNFYCVMDLN